MIKKLPIGNVISTYSILKTSKLGDMPIVDKMKIINLMSAFRGIVGEFENYREDTNLAMADNTPQERMGVLMTKANEIREIDIPCQIDESIFEKLVDVSPQLTIEQLLMLKDTIC
jgi:hypothetical protein